MEVICSLCIINHNFRWKWVAALPFGPFTSRDGSSRYSLERGQGGHHNRSEHDGGKKNPALLSYFTLWVVRNCCSVAVTYRTYHYITWSCGSSLSRNQQMHKIINKYKMWDLLSSGILRGTFPYRNYVIGCWLSFFPTRSVDPWRWDRYVVPKRW
jgi:hypothetical protein